MSSEISEGKSQLARMGKYQHNQGTVAPTEQLRFGQLRPAQRSHQNYGNLKVNKQNNFPLTTRICVPTSYSTAHIKPIHTNYKPLSLGVFFFSPHQAMPALCGKKKINSITIPSKSG
jgi:hypothetical protein